MRSSLSNWPVRVFEPENVLFRSEITIENASDWGGTRSFQPGDSHSRSKTRKKKEEKKKKKDKKKRKKKQKKKRKKKKTKKEEEEETKEEKEEEEEEEEEETKEEEERTKDFNSTARNMSRIFIGNIFRTQQTQENRLTNDDR